MDHALGDVTVLDLGQVIAMPFCTMLLGDLGACVIKVESRGRERVALGLKRRFDGVEERVPAAQYRERNKLAITLELKTTPQGVALFKELVASITAFAQHGPYAAQRGDDMLAQEAAGTPADARLRGSVSQSIDGAGIRSFWRHWAEAIG